MYRCIVSKYSKLYLEQYLWNNVYKLAAATWFYRILCVINDLSHSQQELMPI